MAEFQTFDLGRVLQTGEAIKGMQRQSITDQLQQQYLTTQNNNAQQAGQIATANESRAATQFSQQQQIENTKLLNAAAAEVMANPGAAMRWKPQLEAAGIVPPGQDWSAIPPEQMQAGAKKLYESTSEALSALNGGPIEAGRVGDFSVLKQGGKVISSQAPQRANMPSSYDEFMLAQKDPAFAQFLKDRKGKGISMTMPDGTVVQVGGDGGGVAASDLSGPTKNKLQESIVQATDELDRLNAIGEGFDPKFLQIPGRLKGAALKIKDISGIGNLTPDESQYLTKFSTFKADAAKNLSTILNRLSGAAISPAEGERLKKGIPNDEDSPTQFIAKYKAAVKDSTRAIMRANWALKNGIGVQSVKQLSKAMPLNGIDKVYEDRVNAIWQEMGTTPETKAQAIKQANGEFGLAR